MLIQLIPALCGCSCGIFGLLDFNDSWPTPSAPHKARPLRALWGPKFGRQPATDDVISKYDAARSCFGKQVLHKNRSAPAVGFNHDTRDMRSKTKARVYGYGFVGDFFSVWEIHHQESIEDMLIYVWLMGRGGIKQIQGFETLFCHVFSHPLLCLDEADLTE